MAEYAKDLAEYVAGLRYEDLPDRVVRHAKHVLVDAVACGIAGAALARPWVRAARNVAVGQGSGGPATVWYHGDRVSETGAAFANGVFVHSMDFSDDLAGIQIGGIVAPVALALGESVGASGRDVIAAMVAGYDMAGRLAESMDSHGLYIRGLQPTAMLGGFVSAAVAGKLLGLEAGQLASAFGIVGSYTGGTIEFLKDGTDTKRLHPAKCAASGVTAAYLAKEGMTGPHSIFEGSHGLFKAYSDNPDIEKLVEGLGSRFDILDTSVKPLPFCDGNFAPLEAVLAIMREAGLVAGDIRRVHARMIPSLIPYVMDYEGDTARKYRPETDLDAQMSLPFCIAVGVLKGGDVWFDDFEASVYADPRVQALADKVTAEADAALAHGQPKRPTTMPTVVTLTTEDGRSFTRRVDYQKGDPRNPMSREDFLAKFRRCTGEALPGEAAQRAEETLLSLERLGDVRDLTGALSAGR